jgi:hypothetical protein
MSTWHVAEAQGPRKQKDQAEEAGQRRLQVNKPRLGPRRNWRQNFPPSPAQPAPCFLAPYQAVPPRQHFDHNTKRRPANFFLLSPSHRNTDEKTRRPTKTPAIFLLSSERETCDRAAASDETPAFILPKDKLRSPTRTISAPTLLVTSRLTSDACPLRSSHRRSSALTSWHCLRCPSQSQLSTTTSRSRGGF